MNLIVLLVAAMVFNVCQADDEFAWKLAAREEGRPLDGNSLEVARAKNALKIAKTVCDAKSEEQLGEQAFRTSQVLRKDNVYARPIDILEGMKAILEGNKQQNCVDMMAKYATVRLSTGQSHSEAVASMRVLLNMTKLSTNQNK